MEHGGTRTQYARLIAEQYRAEYEALFGPLADLSDAERFPAVAGPVADPAARAAWEQMAPADRELVNQVFASRSALPHSCRYSGLTTSATPAMLAQRGTAGVRTSAGHSSVQRRHYVGTADQPAGGREADH
ncbi:MAG: hypothetical protein HGA45_11170 [Chloroflexales bacterium]|nr:hypothetical protein [Chloroflexales bacterium]